jgi:transposase
MQKNEYWILIPMKVKITEKRKLESYCGIDPGVRTFMTTFGNNGCKEYNINELMLEKLSKKIKKLKEMRVRKRKLNKLENKQSGYINELHWKTIQHILDETDFVFYEDFKSHEIVKNKKNHRLNKDINERKFYLFKQRLQYKASVRNKQLYLVKANHTTKTCSFCGTLNNPERSKIYHCLTCKRTVGRDVNAAKNILLKGIITHL